MIAALLLGLEGIDLLMIVLYFVVIMAIGFAAARRVKNDSDYFLGGRSFGKALLVFHWLCTGTHSEQAVQGTGASYRVGLGGIWYHWMWLFATPFYWLIAPVTRRLRVMTTGDFFRLRYSPGLELLYAVVALLFYVQSIALLMRGVGTTVSGITGGAVRMEVAIVVLCVMFSTYIISGGLIAAAVTDFLQGVMLIALSLMLVPAGLNALGGLQRLHGTLSPEMFSVVAQTEEGGLGFMIAMSIISLVGIVVQPHTMSATASGKTEMEARVGMCYGNFIKRFLTIAWAFTGIIGVVLFPNLVEDKIERGEIHLVASPLRGENDRGRIVPIDKSRVAPADRDKMTKATEEVFGLSVRRLLPPGWRGLMLACLLAGVTSAETFIVVGSAIFTRNFYVHLFPERAPGHYLLVGRIAAAGMLAVGIAVAFLASSLTGILVFMIELIGLLGACFWVGCVWRRATPAGAWASFVLATVAWIFARHEGWSLVQRAALFVSTEFVSMIVVSLITPPLPRARLDEFFARLYTPVGRESEMALRETGKRGNGETGKGGNGEVSGVHADEYIGDSIPLDYEKARVLGYPGLQRWGIEIPRWNRIDWIGFLAAWGLVAFLILLLRWLAGLGAVA